MVAAETIGLLLGALGVLLLVAGATVALLRRVNGTAPDAAGDEPPADATDEEVPEVRSPAANPRGERPEDVGADAADSVWRPVGLIGRALAGFASRSAYLLLRVTPYSHRFWKNLALTSLQNYHKRAGGDRVGLEAAPNGLRLTPVKWRDAIEELDDQPGWKAKGRDKVWEASAVNSGGTRLGKTPIVPLDSDATTAGSMLECRLSDAIDKGRMRELYRADDGVFRAEIDYTGVDAPGGDTAMADGGASQPQVFREFDPGESPIFEDMLIDIGSGEGFDGSAISFETYQELQKETTTSEQMKQQEVRGYLAGKYHDNKDWIKLFLIAAGLAGLGLVAPYLPNLISALFGGGGGGGGGGSIIPFAISALGGV
jgi:hypothetical protein